jgi:hypothetical protein
MILRACSVHEAVALQSFRMKANLVGGACLFCRCFRQLDLAPFDRFIWPHLLVNLLSAPGRSEALRRPEGDAFRA